VPTLPAEVVDRRGISTAEIVIHPSGKFLYGSNRGHDSVAIYTIDAGTGRLSLQGVESIRGTTPRHFAIDPSGRYLLAAGQNSGTVSVFAIDQETGGLSFTDHTLAVPAPVCILFDWPTGTGR
jgi:6-phosphogluconolactonase